MSSRLLKQLPGWQKTLVLREQGEQTCVMKSWEDCLQGLRKVISKRQGSLEYQIDFICFAFNLTSWWSQTLLCLLRFVDVITVGGLCTDLKFEMLNKLFELYVITHLNTWSNTLSKFTVAMSLIIFQRGFMPKENNIAPKQNRKLI